MQQILNLLESADEAIGTLKILIPSNSLSEALSHYSYLSVLYSHILSLLNNNTYHTPFSTSILNNLLNTLDQLKDDFNEPSHGKTKTVFHYELVPLHRHLKKNLHFWMQVYPSRDEWEAYYQQEEHSIKDYAENRHTILTKEYEYDITIMVLAYNKLEYTKKAIDSILKYTDFSKHRIELLLINNGSSDETSSYFQALEGDHVKIIQLTHPIGFLGVSVGAYAAKGKYFVLFANDIIATANWLDNLLACIQSGDDIAWAVPACNHASNYQTVFASYQNPMEDEEELQEFACAYNKSNPHKWEERVRLIPVLCISPTALFQKAADNPLYYYGEFWDDDLSAQFRRVGLRQIFARDTFVHHFGSISSDQAKIENNSLEVMRGFFYDKWNVDAWDSMYFNQPIIHAAGANSKNTIRMLCVDPLFGSTPLQIRNEQREKGLSVDRIWAIVTDKRYLKDAQQQFDWTFSAESLSDILQQGTIKEAFDCIIFHNDWNQYLDSNTEQLLSLLKDISKPGGKLYFQLNLPGHFRTLQHLANGGFSQKYREPWHCLKFIDPNYIRSCAVQCGWQVQMIPQKTGVSPQEAQLYHSFKALNGNLLKEDFLLTDSIVFDLENK